MIKDKMVAVESFDAEDELVSQTEQLAKWIQQLRKKKYVRRKNPRRDLRVEAVLTCVLSNAEVELRNKQVERILRWQAKKDKLMADIKNRSLAGKEKSASDNWSSCNGGQNIDPKHYQNECSAVCPELSSLDDFMNQLSAIKVHIQR